MWMAGRFEEVNSPPRHKYTEGRPLWRRESQPARPDPAQGADAGGRLLGRNRRGAFRFGVVRSLDFAMARSQNGQIETVSEESPSQLPRN
jgi:hypothetical protein